MASRVPEYLGEPTLGQVMRRPQWIFALLLALVVASVFAWLGQWQMGNAVRNNVDDLVSTETVRPIDDLTEPIAGIPEIAAGAVVSVDGEFVSEDFSIVSDRMNRGIGSGNGESADSVGDQAGEKREGAWVVGHLVRAGHDDASLAVAIGWAPSQEAAQAAIAELEQLPAEARTLEGRYLPAEAPEIPRPDADPAFSRTMVPAYLANNWTQTPTGPIYGGYLVMHDSAAAPALADLGLEEIDSVAPSAPEKVSWLNVFYGIEWAVFGLVALFLWYRLARDAWEKEHEIMALEAEAAREAAAAERASEPGDVPEAADHPAVTEQ